MEFSNTHSSYLATLYNPIANHTPASSFTVLIRTVVTHVCTSGDKEAPNNKRNASDTSHYTSLVTFLGFLYLLVACLVFGRWGLNPS